MMEKRFSRTALLLGEEKLQKIESTRVAIFGLGGVGGYAAEALVRAGVGYIRICDFDTIKYSNFNRQILAVESTVSRLKVDAAQERLLQINPQCIVDKRPVFVDEQNAGELLKNIDIAIDAIDSVSSKVSLLAAAVNSGVDTVTCMGAATKQDPFQIRADDIDESRNCPLARIIRKRLHRRGIYTGIRCVYSLEVSNKTLSETIDSEEVFERGRPRPPLGSISYMTGMFGLVAAHEVLKIITGKLEESVQSAVAENELVQN